MNKPKKIGTAVESAVVRYLQGSGLPERILSKGRWTSSGCLEFMGARANGGYGKTAVGSRSDGTRRLERVHRLAWAAVHGEIPPELMVCHRCDNPPCFNYEHLFLGTAADNTTDMVAKGRHQYVPHQGRSNGRARLTEAEVRLIRELSVGGRSCRSIARLFGVAGGTVSSIVRRENWGWLA